MIERVIPFEIKRIFYVNGPDHFKNGGNRQNMKQAVICLKGRCLVTNHTGTGEEQFVLDTADQCLLLAPEDRYDMPEIADESILMVLASEPFEQQDPVQEPFQYELSLA